MAKSSGFKLIANNKKAYFDFFIDDKFECGIALAGTEVKSMRMGKCSIKDHKRRGHDLRHAHQPV
mgnify:CR=1 FL=1